jgi:hypothetical protein
MQAIRVPWTVEDLPVCNCALCGRELLGKVPPDRRAEVKLILDSRAKGIPRLRVTARLDGRPYCRACFAAKSRPVIYDGARFNGTRVNNKLLPE